MPGFSFDLRSQPAFLSEVSFPPKNMSLVIAVVRKMDGAVAPLVWRQHLVADSGYSLSPPRTHPHNIALRGCLPCRTDLDSALDYVGFDYAENREAVYLNCHLDIGRLSELPNYLGDVVPAATDAVAVCAHGVDLRFLLLWFDLFDADGEEIDDHALEQLTPAALERLLCTNLCFAEGP